MQVLWRKEAINHLLAHEDRFIKAVEKGLASLDRGESISHKEVGRRTAGGLVLDPFGLHQGTLVTQSGCARKPWNWP